jgi:hypothetical protein
MSLFTDDDKEWKKATAKPRIPPPILRKDSTFVLDGIELKVQRPDTLAHKERGKQVENKKKQDGRVESSIKSPSFKHESPGFERDLSQRSRSFAGASESKSQGSAGSSAQYQQHSSQISTGYPDFAPDASDLANSCPAYGSGFNDTADPPSPTYVREPSPPATWAVDTEINQFQIHTHTSDSGCVLILNVFLTLD